MARRYLVGEESSDGWVKYSEYLLIRAALREALEDWEGWMPTTRSNSTLAEKGRTRIAALRAQFLDDK